MQTLLNKLKYIIFLSWKVLSENKLRSILTIGGIAIGIGTIVFLVSLGFGLQRLIVSQVTDVESLTVLDVSTGTSALIRIDDTILKKFADLPNVVTVSPSLNVTGQAINGSTATDIAIFGVDPAFISLEGITVSWGTNLDTSAGPSEVVISSTAANLLGYEDPNTVLGQSVQFDIVVPTTSEEEGAGEKIESVNGVVRGVSDEEINVAYLPVTTLRELGFTSYNLARVKLAMRDQLRDARTAIEQMGFQVDSVADTVGQIDQIFIIFEVVMGVFGLIAMAVASLGAFNTLTVSLLERTHEVGLMISLGTKRRFIYNMFLVESFIIGVVGGLSGLIFGLIVGEAVDLVINILAGRLGGQPVDIFWAPWYFMLIVAVLVLLIGFFTGIYPARRASKINPLDALRYE